MEEYRGESHRIESNLKIGVHYIGAERLRSTPDVSSKLGRVREDGWDNHRKTISARSQSMGPRVQAPERF